MMLLIALCCVALAQARLSPNLTVPASPIMPIENSTNTTNTTLPDALHTSPIIMPIENISLPELTLSPSMSPTMAPTEELTLSPSMSPTMAPSMAPTEELLPPTENVILPGCLYATQGIEISEDTRLSYDICEYEVKYHLYQMTPQDVARPKFEPVVEILFGKRFHVSVECSPEFKVRGPDGKAINAFPYIRQGECDTNSINYSALHFNLFFPASYIHNSNYTLQHMINGQAHKMRF